MSVHEESRMLNIGSQSVGWSLGFTLMELMIVVAIISILAVVAFPAYQQYVIRANRADVQAELLQIAQRIQNYKVVNGSYTGIALSQPSIYGSAVFPKTGKTLYDLTLALGDRDGLVTDWTIQASPKSDSIQQGNGVIQLNDLGYKCWEKAQTTCTLSANSNWSEK